MENLRFFLGCAAPSSCKLSNILDLHSNSNFVSSLQWLEIEIISQYPTQFGDSPVWCSRTQSLLYTDFFGIEYNIYRYDYQKREVYRAKIFPEQENAAFIILIEGSVDEFAIGFRDRSVKRVYWDGESDIAVVMETLFDVEQSSYYEGNLWHVAKVDPEHRFYGGTMRSQLCTPSSSSNGSFYRYTDSRGVRKLFGGIGISNGIEWSVKKGKLFHIDACDFAIKSYDWNRISGNLGKLIDIKKQENFIIFILNVFRQRRTNISNIQR